MEKNTHIREEEFQAPNTSGRVIPINDLYMDLQFTSELSVTIENCPHSFSMIGYVSEMRERNPEVSNSFPGQDLPPFPAPIRPRRCPLCLTCIGATTSANGGTLVSGDSVDVPLETHVPVAEEMVQVIADTEIAPVEPAANTDSNIVRNDRVIETNSDGNVRDDQEMETSANNDVNDDQPLAANMDSDVRNHHEIVNGGEMDVEGNGSVEEDDDFQLLSVLRQVSNLRRLRNSGDDEHPVSTETPIITSVHVPNTADSVRVIEFEQLNNSISNRDKSKKKVSLPKSPKKVRYLDVLFLKTEALKRFDYTEEELAYYSNANVSSEPTTSLPNGQFVEHAVGECSNSHSRKRRARKTRAAEPSGLGLQTGNESDRLHIGNKSDRLKRKAQKNHSMAKKKGKSVPLKISEPRSAEPSNNQSQRETVLQIPDSTTLNNCSSRMELHGANSHLHYQNGVERRSSVRKERNINPPRSEHHMVKRSRLLDQNLSDPKENDILREKENDVPSRSNIEERDGNDADQGSSEDFPMDILELMARNQYERSLGNASSQSEIPPSNIQNIRRLLGLQDTRNNSDVGTSSSNGFSFQNSRNTGAEKGKSIDYNYHTARNVPERSVLEPSFFPPRTSIMPFSSSSVQNFSGQTPESHHNRKSVRDMMEDELKKTQATGSRNIDLNHRLDGPLDRYSNDYIPAMQLMSLKNANSTGRGTSSFQDIRPSRTLVQNEFCSVNINPAEFSIPEEGNEFTIHGEDLKFRKGRYSGPGKSFDEAGGSNDQHKKDNEKSRKGKANEE